MEQKTNEQATREFLIGIINNLSVDQLYEAVFDITITRPEISKDVSIPNSVLTCGRCQEVYGLCRALAYDEDLDGTCEERFRNWCSRPVEEGGVE